MKKYWIESCHGVIVDIVYTLGMVKKRLQEKSPFRSVPLRAFYHEDGKKVYLKETHHD